RDGEDDGLPDVERFGVAELVGGGAVPASVLARLACDSVVSRIVFGPRSEVVDVGRSQRTFTGPRRRAVVARDGRCRFPGCDAPPALCEVHHVRHWARDGGDTDAGKGVLLCWHHHARVHALGIEITRRGSRWHFTDRHGRPLPGADVAGVQDVMDDDGDDLCPTGTDGSP
ncbi:HNH endonuclease signature motif containing protein, partial [Cellulomonas marina]